MKSSWGSALLLGSQIEELLVVFIQSTALSITLRQTRHTVGQRVCRTARIYRPGPALEVILVVAVESHGVLHRRQRKWLWGESGIF